jgi:hypothetical protein
MEEGQRFTLIDVMLGIDKHGLVCKLSEESFTFLIGIILEHNRRGFKTPFDMNNLQAMAAGGGNTPKSVRRRRANLSKFKIGGKALLKVISGNYGRNTCAKYEINYKSLLSYKGVWSGELDLPAQIWDKVKTDSINGQSQLAENSRKTREKDGFSPSTQSVDITGAEAQPDQIWSGSGESSGRVEGRVEGTVPGPILRSEEKRGEENSPSPTSNVVTKQEGSKKPQPGENDKERFKLLLGQFQKADMHFRIVNDIQRQKVIDLLQYADGEIEAVMHRAAEKGVQGAALITWAEKGLADFDRLYNGSDDGLTYDKRDQLEREIRELGHELEIEIQKNDPRNTAWIEQTRQQIQNRRELLGRLE